jgi:hypothetical protein
VNRRQALLAAGAVLALPSFAAADGRWTKLDLRTGLIFLDGAVNGRPLLTMIDSGSAPTLVDSYRTIGLGLALSQGGSAVGTSGGQADAWRTGDFELSVAGVVIHFPPESVLSLDLSGLAPGWSVGAIAGQALFEAARLDLDLPRSRIRVARDSTRGWAKLPLGREADGLRCAPLRIGDLSVPAATFDLGSAIPLQVSRGWAEAHGVLDGLRQSDWIANGIDGPSRFATATLPRIGLAGFEMLGVPVAIIDHEPPGSSPVVIGTPIWRRFRLVADYGEDALWLQPDKGRLKARFNRDRSGLAISYQGEFLMVTHVAQGSPAEAGGWVVGDRIVAIDGRRIASDWPGSPQSGWARQKAGVRVRLRLADGRDRDLVLADYY